MKKYLLERRTVLKTSIEKAWNFFSNPVNLSAITPPGMKFTIVTQQLPDKVYTGLKIQYKVSPLFDIDMNWTSIIKEVKEPYFFADEQEKGPYALWYHEHSFEETGDGVVMKDKVTYAMPYGFIGRVAHILVVRKKINDIFDFREKEIRKLFRG